MLRIGRTSGLSHLIQTKSMLISNKKTPHPPLYFDNCVLNNVTSHKHLGLILNSKLNWSDHIECMIRGISKCLDVMHKLMYALDRKTLETIYFSFMRPKLEYASIVWDNCYSKEKISP